MLQQSHPTRRLLQVQVRATIGIGILKRFRRATTTTTESNELIMSIAPVSADKEFHGDGPVMTLVA